MYNSSFLAMGQQQYLYPNIHFSVCTIISQFVQSFLSLYNHLSAIPTIYVQYHLLDIGTLCLYLSTLVHQTTV